MVTKRKYYYTNIRKSIFLREKQYWRLRNIFCNEGVNVLKGY